MNRHGSLKVLEFLYFVQEKFFFLHMFSFNVCKLIITTGVINTGDAGGHV